MRSSCACACAGDSFGGAGCFRAKGRRASPHRLDAVLRDVEAVQVPQQLHALAVAEHVASGVDAAQIHGALQAAQLQSKKEGREADWRAVSLETFPRSAATSRHLPS